MDFDFSKEQKMFEKSVEEFAAKEIAPGVDEREYELGFSRDVWNKMSQVDLTGLCLPEQYGGAGADALTTVIAAIAFARGSFDGSMCTVWGSHLFLAAMSICDLGSEEQKERYLPGMATGERIGALALTEPEAGTDATSLATTAVRDGDYYILNGSKTFISNAPIADVFVTYATMDISKRAGGITGFIVERDTPGLTCGPPMRKHFGKSTPTGEMFFNDAKIPAENLLGKEGEGFTAMIASLGWERLAFAPIVGLMEAELDLCIDYAKTRKQFGKPVGKFQLVQAMLAEMKMDLEASRYLALSLAWKKDQGIYNPIDAAIAKTFITEAAERNSRKAVQIHGGMGCMQECKAGRNFWSAKTAAIGGGTSQIQRVLIGRLLTGM
ncbi:Acyl-CoA dehydrogenase domain protein [Desulfatibacillum aliphaticivorans]|uniref:Acyl-CoA dehydrogenase domain protein n=1 Tax=Desulfatibacillum aliphaticivorans TaxID=218208 RepID=B8F9B9_DESAL|nr:acyl-CoA dehydrogenase family protein [Desulfatibacillum aliphaticivorans]ACL02865.1 Acyl-CoA dehydrogenase domain protein [Desulfatibacillum aliphaticivorans]